MTTDTTIDAAAARPVQRDRVAPASMPRNDDGMPEPQSDMSFWDVLDVVNPLQHIPIVNNIYRAVTGDEIKAPARVMGGILFGGVIGGAAAIANAVLEQSTGHDLGGHMLASLGFEDKPAAAAGGTAVADAAATGKAAQGAVPTASGGAPATAAPATPQTVAAATTAALRPTASAVPPPTVAPPALSPPTLSPDAAARLQTAAAAGGLPLRDALASPTGDHRPSKMPARDTIPANTMQAKQAAALANQQRFARLGETPATAGAATAKPTASAAPPQTAPAAAAAAPALAQPASAQQAAATTAPGVAAQATMQAPAAPGDVPPAMLPDVMMRNLAKYEAARRAAAAKTGTSTRVDG